MEIEEKIGLKMDLKWLTIQAKWLIFSLIRINFNRKWLTVLNQIFNDFLLMVVTLLGKFFFMYQLICLVLMKCLCKFVDELFLLN